MILNIFRNLIIHAYNYIYIYITILFVDPGGIQLQDLAVLAPEVKEFLKAFRTDAAISIELLPSRKPTKKIGKAIISGSCS